jgi:diaminopropionate ammonia-lyase
MSVAKAGENGRSWSCLNRGSTPLYGLKGLAEEVGVGETLLKDESVRSIFGRFNALGVP